MGDALARREIRNHAIFRGLVGSDMKLLGTLLDLSPHRMKDGATLVGQGEATDRFWIVVSGEVHGVRTESGEREHLRIFRAGDTVCLDVVSTRTRRSPFQVKCVGEADLVEIDYDSLVHASLSRHSYCTLMLNIAYMLSDEIIKQQYLIDTLYKRTLRGRVLSFLRLMGKKKGGGEIDIGMNREQLAAYLGAHRCALSRELGQMQRDGILDFHKSRFRLL
jgi:CRP-like cAMP-binding protein